MLRASKVSSVRASSHRPTCARVAPAFALALPLLGACGPSASAPAGDGGLTDSGPGVAIAPEASLTSDSSARGTDASTLASDSSAPAPEAAAPRDPAQWPFASSSPWNVPLATTAQYEAATDAETKTILSTASNSYVNRASYSMPVFLAASSDPLATLTYGSGYVNGNWAGKGTVSIHVPASAAASGGTDSSIVIVTPDHLTGYESWQFAGTAPSFTTSYTVEQDLKGVGWGEGIHAAGCSLMGGLIRAWELEALEIPHALAVGIATTQARSPYVWPAVAEDSGAATSYTGTVPMGTLLAIDPAANIDTLASSPQGKALALALQDYGAYVIDTAGTATGVGFVVDPEGTTEAQANALRGDVAALVAHLRVVTNNTQASPGGGGPSAPRRAPAAPPF